MIRCGACRTYVHPESTECPVCGSDPHATSSEPSSDERIQARLVAMVTAKRRRGRRAAVLLVFGFLVQFAGVVNTVLLGVELASVAAISGYVFSLFGFGAVGGAGELRQIGRMSMFDRAAAEALNPSLAYGGPAGRGIALCGLGVGVSAFVITWVPTGWICLIGALITMVAVILLARINEGLDRAYAA